MAMMGKIRRKRFGEILVAEKLVNQEQVKEALAIQSSSGDSLGNILLDLGYILEADIVKALSIQYQIPYISTQNYEIDSKTAALFDARMLHKHSILPFDQVGNLILALTTDIPSKEVMEGLQKSTECDIALYLGAQTDVQNKLMEIAPISSDDLKSLKAERQALKEDPTRQKANLKKDSGELQVDQMDFSSEKILSSLDEAWDSIFVENGEGPGEDE